MRKILVTEKHECERYLTSEDVAAILKLSTATVLHYTSNSKKYSHLLPGWFKLPGRRRNFWLASTVRDFLDAAEMVGRAELSEPRKRGRPTKVEQLRARSDFAA